MIRSIILIFCLFTTLQSKAQRRETFFPYSSISVGGGSSFYGGDLTPAFYKVPLGILKMTRWNGGINYTKFISQRVGVRTSFNWIRLSGDDFTVNKNNLDNPDIAGLFIRNLHFRNDLKEFTISGVYNLIPTGRTSQHRVNVQPYVFAGIGFFAHNPKARRVSEEPGEKKPWVSLSDKLTEGQASPYSSIQFTVPFGAGFRIKMSERMDISLEAAYRYTSTDYIDDVSSSTYPDPSTLKDDTSRELSNRTQELLYAARTGEDRIELLVQALATKEINDIFDIPAVTRGSKTPDAYLTFQVSVSYLINKKLSCPPIK